MAKKRPGRRPRSTEKNGASESAFDAGGGPINDLGLETTGRNIVTFLDKSTDSVKRSLSAMKSRAGIASVCHTADFTAKEFSFEAAEDADMIVLDELGIAVVNPDGGRTSALASIQEAGDTGMVVEPDYINYAFFPGLDEDVLETAQIGSDGDGANGITAYGPDYLRGYHQAVQHLVGSLAGVAGPAIAGERSVEALAAFADTATATWGLHATRVLNTTASGRGIRLAVLDTGLDLAHPDFAGRTIRTQSFIPGEAVQDAQGHGTHCIGTACGPRRPPSGPRYGIAYEAEIFAGKVLSNAGSGSDAGILAGINWAMQNRCQVISMSLGRPTRPGERPTQNYEIAGQRALQAGTLIVAAAGNESFRPTVINPVGSPANASTIVAVAAVDANLQVARFSNRAINPGGGEVNIAGPGVAVFSTWRMPLRYRTIDGTSMATPHVAGIAALIAQQSTSFRGVALYHELRRRGRRLPISSADVGNGLVEAV